jgi:hypothetical protein
MRLAVFADQTIMMFVKCLILCSVQFSQREQISPELFVTLAVARDVELKASFYC